MSIEQKFKKCVGAYFGADYAECVRRVDECISAHGSGIEIWQLKLISLKHLKNSSCRESAENEAMEIFKQFPWELDLLRITSGQTLLKDVLLKVKSPEQECQALFYAGANLVAERELSEAIEMFKKCVSLNANCMECRFADIELPRVVRIRAAELNEIVTKSFSAGRLETATSPAREALTLYCEHFGDEDLTAATLHSNLGVLIMEAGDYDEARSELNRSLELRQKLLGMNHAETAQSLKDIGRLLVKRCEANRALPYLKQALQVSRQVFGPEAQETANYIRGVGDGLRESGNDRSALNYYEEALAIVRNSDDNDDIALLCNDLGSVLQSLGEFAKAVQYFEKALAAYRAHFGEHDENTASPNNLGSIRSSFRRRPGRPEIAKVRCNLGSLLVKLGKYREGRLHLEAALETQLAVWGPDSIHTASPLCGLGVLFAQMGEWTAAFHHHSKSLEIIRKHRGEDHPETALALSNMGMLCGEAGDYSRAIELIEQAIRVTESSLGREHQRLGEFVHNLGHLYQLSGQNLKARNCFERAISIFRQSDGDSLLISHSFNNLATLSLAEGDVGMARDLYKRALEIQIKALGKNHSLVHDGLINLAFTFAADDAPEEALNCLKKAADISEKTIQNVFSIASERERSRYLHTIRSELDFIITLTVTHLSSLPEARRAAFDLVLRRKAIGFDAMAAQQFGLLRERNPEMQSRLQNLLELRSFISWYNLVGGAEVFGSEQNRQMVLATSTHEKEELEKELAQHIPEISNAHLSAGADWKALASVLSDKTALVEFVRYSVAHPTSSVSPEQRESDVAYVAFVLNSMNPSDIEMIDLGDAITIDKLVESFRSWVIGRSDRKTVMDSLETAGQMLYDAVFKPLAKLSELGTELIIAPDGELWKLPFEVLPLGDSEHVIDRYQISYVTVGRELIRANRRAPGNPKPPVVVADPDFDSGSSDTAVTDDETPNGRTTAQMEPGQNVLKSLQFCGLPGTALEGHLVAKALGVRPLMQGEALAGTIRDVQSPRILHLATHGFFLDARLLGKQKPQVVFEMPDTRQQGVPGSHLNKSAFIPGPDAINPLILSGIALTGANWASGKFVRPEEKGTCLLTADDVSGMDLRDTELVVLSACETGLGEIQVGEGVMGLRRSFALAGARTLVISLWKVPDLATTVLMDRFYSNLLGRGSEGRPLSRHLALCEARLFVRDVTVRELRGLPLLNELGELPEKPGKKIRRQVELIFARPDEHRPFRSAFYWGAFVCDGQTDPLSLPLPPPRLVTTQPQAVQPQIPPHQGNQISKKRHRGKANKPWWKFWEG